MTDWCDLKSIMNGGIIFKLWLGVDVFYGDKKGLFGQFDANDRIVAGVEWAF